MNMSSLEYHITDDDQLFFLHIPKTAGTALTAILDQYFDKREIFPFYYPRQLSGVPDHFFDQYRYFRGHFPYEFMRKRLGSKAICLTILREPVERFISQFAYLQRQPHPFKPQVERFKVSQHEIEQFRDMTLPELVNGSKAANLVRFFQNGQTRKLVTRFNFRTPDQLKEADKNRDKIRSSDIELAKKRLNDFTFVGLTERFQESLCLLAYTFGWPPLTDFRRLNVTSNKPRREQIPPETLEKIVELNALDLELYAYAQQLFETRFTQMTRELWERYGQRSHTHLKPPLSQEVMGNLLENHYARRYAERHQPVQSISFKFDQAISGLGWHLPEEHPEHGPYRWTGPATRSTIDFPLVVADDVLIRFAILATMTPDVLDSLTLRVNNHPIPLAHRLDNNGTTIFTGYIPPAVVTSNKGFTRLAFEVDQTIAPCTLDPASDDERPLGVAINWLEISPAPVRTEVAKISSKN